MSSEFHRLTIKDIRSETRDSISVCLDVPDELAEAFMFRAGQHITLKADVNGEELRRNYSLCVSPHEGEVRVAIKRILDGRFSNWANETLKKGESIEVMAPHGAFTTMFSPDTQKSYLGIAGGSGITPILSLLKTALLSEPSSRFTLLYGNRDSDSVMFLETLAALKNKFMDRLEVYHFLEDEEDEDVPLFNGRLDREKLDSLAGSLIDAGNIDEIFICGPGPMMDAAESAFLTLGIPQASIHVERFTVDRPSTDEVRRIEENRKAAEGRKISIVMDGRRRKLSYDSSHGSILENIHAAGMPAPFACKAGVCATCRAKLVSGEVEMAVNYGLSPEEVEQGYVLTCQALPLSDDVVLDFDG